MLRMQAAGNIILRDIQQRITKFEDVIKNRGLNLPESNSLIAHLLPLNTKQDIKKFESILKTTNDEAVIQFVRFKFIRKILIIIFCVSLLFFFIIHIKCIYIFIERVCI